MTENVILGIITAVTSLAAVFFGANGYFQARRNKEELPQQVEAKVEEQVKPVQQRFDEAASGLETVLPLIQQMQRKINQQEEAARIQNELWAKVMIAWARHEAWDQQVGNIARQVDPNLPEPPSLSDLLK